jgi:cobyrinic acid a,c-diamide synthase
LYDGDAMSAEFARALSIPVLLVLDADDIAQSGATLELVLRQYSALPDSPPSIAGVILNRVVDASQAEKIGQALRTTSLADTPVLATIPLQPDGFSKRHWMQLSSQQQEKIERALDQLGQQIVIDMDAWQKLPHTTIDDAKAKPASPALLFVGKKIAVACDAAFAFAYFGNLKCLRDAGAVLQFFSPLQDEAVPPEADAIYLPGGYPEQHCATLAAAQCWQDSMRAAHAAGKPILAECGGMMTLADRMRDIDGKVWTMAGLLPGEVTVHPDLIALGMQTLSTDDGILRGHVFHYSTLATPLTSCAHTLKRRNGERGEEVYRHGSLTATYFHAYFSSCPAAVADMLERQKS